MLLTTTPQIEGHTIREYKGVVTGETIIGANILKDIFAGIRDLVGGRSAAYEKVLIEAKDTSMQEMAERARAMGANAVVGIDVDYETIGSNGSMLMVATSVTVRLFDFFWPLPENKKDRPCKQKLAGPVVDLFEELEQVKLDAD